MATNWFQTIQNSSGSGYGNYACIAITVGLICWATKKYLDSGKAEDAPNESEPVAEDKDEANKSNEGSQPVEISRDPRTVVVHREKGHGVGIAITGGEHGAGIFVSDLVAGSAGDKAGLRQFDQILSVNEVDLTDQPSHYEAKKALNQAGPVVTLKLQYKPDEYVKQMEEAKKERLRILRLENPDIAHLYKD